MKSTNRREFIKQSTISAGGIMFGVSAADAKSSFIKKSANDTIHIAVVGINSKGKHHYKRFAEMPNVRVAALCDVDERLFPEAVAKVEEIGGYKPKTETDIRRLLEDKEIDAISIATPDHWHALMTIWACQAGKDVYVEKPVSYTIDEGRKMVQAARKYNCIVQAGMNYRAGRANRAAMKFLNDGKLGEIYMAKGICYKPRNSIGHTKDSPIPKGVHWDLHRGPAPYIPFNENRFHYNWHWFWDTSTTEMGNIVHQMDLARWGLNKHVHPVKVHSAGGYFVWDSDQETPNTQHAIFEYEDGKILQYEVRGVYTNAEGGIEGVGNLFLGSKGYMTSAGGWSTFYCGSENSKNPNFPKRTEEPGPVMAETDLSRFPEADHYTNFIDCMRSRRWQDLYADIEEGHKSTVLSHLANISYRTGRKLIFDPESETFVNDDEANAYLTREYRHPYVMPHEV